MRAAGICPHIWESDLFTRSLLQKELLGRRMKEEGREGTVEETLVDVRHEMAVLLGSSADGIVILIEYYAHFVHEPDLFIIITGKIVVDISIARGAIGCGGVWGKVSADEASVHFWKQRAYIVGVDGRGGSSSRCRCGRHAECSNFWALKERLRVGKATKRLFT